MDELRFVANFLGFLSVWILGILVRGFFVVLVNRLNSLCAIMVSVWSCPDGLVL